jgi:ubiquinol-cytochrome c reductase cytochrome b subunit
VWYFTPFYSMLRATTDQMTWVFILALALAAAFACIRTRLAMPIKVVIVIAAAIVMVLLRTIDAKFWGVVVMGGAVIILFFLPWLDRSPARSIRYRPQWHRYVYAVFVLVFLMLGWLGVEPPSPLFERMSQVGTIVYFGFFLLMPWWSRLGEPKPVPERVVFAAH